MSTNNLNPNLIEFLKKPEVKDAINVADFNKVYFLADNEGLYSLIGDLTRMFEYCGMLPLVLSKLTILPCYFLCNDTRKTFDIPDNIEGISHAAFYGCKLSSIILKDNIQYVDNGAFERCYNLTNVTVTSKATRISLFAFKFCDNVRMTCKQGSSADGIAQACNYPITYID